MTDIIEFELAHDVELLSSRDSFVRRFLAVFGVGLDAYWVTYRLPLMPRPVITYPFEHKATLSAYDLRVLDHELVHVQQFRPWWATVVLPLLATLYPLSIIFSGRWFIERPAYLRDIRAGRLTVEQACETLWLDYGWAWPRFLMRRWFNAQLGRK